VKPSTPPPVLIVIQSRIQLIECTFYIFPSKVHITSETLGKLNDEFRVVAGEGHLRDDYLLRMREEINLETYFIVDSEVNQTC
jgi:hypothetical protein